MGGVGGGGIGVEIGLVTDEDAIDGTEGEGGGLGERQFGDEFTLDFGAIGGAGIAEDPVSAVEGEFAVMARDGGIRDDDGVVVGATNSHVLSGEIDFSGGAFGGGVVNPGHRMGSFSDFSALDQ